MPTFKPAFAIVPLQQLAPAAFTIYRRAGAFVGVNRGAQGAVHGRVPHTLAVHDAQHQKFVYHYFEGADPNLLVPRDELIIRPNLLSLTNNAPLQPATDKLFQGDDTYLVVEIPTSGELRLLSLTSEALVRPMVAGMDAFDSWEVGVESVGGFVPLLTI